MKGSDSLDILGSAGNPGPATTAQLGHGCVKTATDHPRVTELYSCTLKCEFLVIFTCPEILFSGLFLTTDENVNIILSSLRLSDTGHGLSFSGPS